MNFELFVSMFENNVDAYPTRKAVVCGSAALSYFELNRKANSLAKTLTDNGIEKGMVVGVLMDRGVNLLVSMIAIFKIRAVYMPLDIQDSDDRINYILEKSGCKLLLSQTQAATSRIVSQYYHVPIVNVSKLSQQCYENPSSLGEVSDLAYLIFTSVLSGKPKGVMVEQERLTAQLEIKANDLEITTNDCIAQSAHQCFEISIWQSLSALCVGGTTAIMSQEALGNTLVMTQEINQKNVSVIQFIPSLLLKFVGDLEAEDPIGLPSLRYVSTVSEPLLPGLCRRWLSLYPHVALLNHYGPTECADGVIHYIHCTPPTVDTLQLAVDHPRRHSKVIGANTVDSPVFHTGKAVIDNHEVIKNNKDNLLTFSGALPTPTMHFIADAMHSDEHWTISGLWDSSYSDVDVEQLNAAFEQLTDDYPYLNTRILKQSSQLKLLASGESLSLEREMIGFFETASECEAAISAVTSEMQRAFMLDGQCPLIRFVWMDAEIKQQPHSWLFLVVHRYLIDSAGFQLLLDEIERYYDHTISRLEPTAVYDDGHKMNRWLSCIIREVKKNLEKEMLFWASKPWPLLLTVTGDETGSVCVSDMEERNRLSEAINLQLSNGQCQSPELLQLCERNNEIYYFLDDDKTEKLLSLNHFVHGFEAYDLILSTLVEEMGAGDNYKALFIDSYDRYRTHTSDQQDLSKMMAMTLQILPLPLVLNTQDELMSKASDVARQRREIPHHGLGFRVAKTLLGDECPSVLANTPWPDISINYCVGKDRRRTQGLLNMQESTMWTGETLGLDQEHCHRLRITIDLSENRMQFHIRYDATRYSPQYISELTESLDKRLSLGVEEIEQLVKRNVQGVDLIDNSIDTEGVNQQNIE